MPIVSPHLHLQPLVVAERSGGPDLAPVIGLVDLTVVLPAHNESKLLSNTVTDIYSGLLMRGFAFEIVIVENGSSDGTLERARELAGQLAHVRVLALPVGNYGAALAAGYAAARGTVLVSFDVDYYDLDFLDDALDVLEHKDVALVIASKRCPGAIDARPAFRRLLTWAFSVLLHRLVDLSVSDAHGMKAFARLPLEPVIAACEMCGSLFDVEMIVRAEQRGLVAFELPATVAEVRPCRTPVWRRSIEGLVGAVRLKSALRR